MRHINELRRQALGLTPTQEWNNTVYKYGVVYIDEKEFVLTKTIRHYLLDPQLLVQRCFSLDDIYVINKADGDKLLKDVYPNTHPLDALCEVLCANPESTFVARINDGEGGVITVQLKASQVASVVAKI